MKLGIIQGRLSPPINDQIQEFPVNDWEMEFNIIHQLNLKHIEWVVTKESFNNKIFNLDIKKYSKLISCLCCDNIIDENITSIDFLNENLKPICDWGLRNNINKINIPLLEKSQITNDNKEILFQTLKQFSLFYPEIEFHFECESDIEICLELVKKSKNFFLIYDTGNITSMGFDHKEWITKGFNFIKNVHLKDRKINPVKTVYPLTGNTNFKLIFDLLRKKNYNGLFTIQTARGETGKEIQTIKKHKKIFENLYNE
jgi:hypothetical protein